MTKKTKLPKTVFGVKLPKELRKQGGALIDKANSPAGREMIAGVLTVAAAAASAAAAKSRAHHAASPDVASPDAASSVNEAGNRAAPGHGGSDPQKIADAIGGAAELVMARLFGGARG